MRNETFFSLADAKEAVAEKLEELSGVPVPRQIRELQTLPIRHKRVCEVSGMEEALMEEWK